MPTVILLDLSFPMCRQSSRRSAINSSISSSNRGRPIIKLLATAGVNVLCDYLAQNSPLEHVALLVSSSIHEIRHQFTRDHESIKSSAHSLDVSDKSNIINAFKGISILKLDEWSKEGPINIILITDGQVHHSDPSKTNPNDVDLEFWDSSMKDFEGLFNFDCKLQVIFLTPPRDSALKQSLAFFRRLVSIVDRSTNECPVITGQNLRSHKRSAIWLPESNSIEITREDVDKMFTNVAELNYKPHNVILSCGHLSSLVILSPRPVDCLVEPLKNEFDDLKNEESQTTSKSKETYVSALNKKRLFEISDEINICGFMPLSEVASPAIASRHMVFPIPNNKFNEIAKAEQILNQDPNAYSNSLQIYPIEQESNTSNNGDKEDKSYKMSRGKFPTNSPPSEHSAAKDITKQPSFCVLLHSCLRQENLVAVCIVGKNDETSEEWFGILHSHTDTKKRSCLMLSLLLPGSSPILWLPNFKTLGSASLNADLPQTILDRLAGATSAPGQGNKSSSKSYSTNNVIWLDPESVQMDVQKIVRHAKRAPEKAPHFYKELNRIRRAAISYGFYDVLYGLASILEREKQILLSDPSKLSSMDVIKHIDHVIANLRIELTDESYHTNIAPPVD